MLIGGSENNFTSYFFSGGNGNGNIPSSVSYGLFSQTADSDPIVNTTEIRTLIGDGVGALSVSANTFKVGDSFQITMIGHLSAINSDLLTINLIETNSSIILATSGGISMRGSTNQHFELQATFTIRQIGAPTIASIFTGAFFNYARDSSNTLESVIFSNGNSTTFDTTQNNRLDITAEWSNASPNNSIYSEILSLTKIY
jgi:hypothetical protein